MNVFKKRVQFIFKLFGESCVMSQANHIQFDAKNKMDELSFSR